MCYTHQNRPPQSNVSWECALASVPVLSVQRFVHVSDMLASQNKWWEVVMVLASSMMNKSIFDRHPAFRCKGMRCRLWLLLTMLSALPCHLKVEEGH